MNSRPLITVDGDDSHHTGHKKHPANSPFDDQVEFNENEFVIPKVEKNELPINLSMANDS